ncbi:hypothetical protein WJX75_005306 [Coccomyxa subellipsoidea]|uniref:Uncharacterized protein n=1 Tax=Coccomyxa subellipsoidea TaxID=248742 RepID=A0ABR2YML8_9CHLO
MQLLTFLVETLILASVVSGSSPAPAPSNTKSKSWTVEIKLPKNCTANTQTKGYELQSCKLSCDVQGPTRFFLSAGTSINISFKTKPTLVVIGGSQNLEFLNDEIPDMMIQKALAPPNPIVDYGFAGFTFSPHQKFYSMFKNGVLAKLAIYAFDTSASPGKSAAKGLATYRAGNTAEMAARRQLLSKVLPPTLISYCALQRGLKFTCLAKACYWGLARREVCMLIQP